MGNTFFFQWEINLMIWLQGALGSKMASLGSFLTLFGEEIMLIAILGFLYWSYDKKIGKFVGINIAVALVWNPLIKNIFIRRRPYFDTPEIKCLKPVSKEGDIYDIAVQGYSFPSGHTMNATTAYGTIAYRLKKKWAWTVAVILSFIVGFSRVYLGNHFPTDVLVGWIMGAIIVLLVSFLQNKIKNKLIFYGLLIVTSFPGMFYCTSDDYFTAFGLLIGVVLGILFEEKFVNFESTRNPVRMVLRVLGGGLIYLGLNAVLKLPFGSDFLSSGTLPAHIVRVIRYTIVLFVDIGVYPMLFKVTDRIFNKCPEV